MMLWSSMAHANSGSRWKPRPGARMLTSVVMMFMACGAYKKKPVLTHGAD